jgi:hypothetical protein
MLPFLEISLALLKAKYENLRHLKVGNNNTTGQNDLTEWQRIATREASSSARGPVLDRTRTILPNTQAQKTMSPKPLTSRS